VSSIGIRKVLSRLKSIGARVPNRGFISTLRRNERWVAEARSTPSLQALYTSATTQVKGPGRVAEVPATTRPTEGALYPEPA
jgi:hypothetical protein